MQKNSVWSRVNAWLRGDEQSGHIGGSSDGRPNVVISESVARKENGPAQSGASAAPLRPMPASEPGSNGPADRNISGAASLRGRDDRVVELVAAVKDHLEAQVQGADILVGALDRLAEGIEGLPNAAKNELDVLERIRVDVASTLGAAKRLETTLVQVPKLADAQRETMVTLNNELTRLRETDTRIATALDGVQQVMVELRDGIGRSAGAMRDFRSEMADRHEHLASLVERQSQRFVWLAGGAIALGALAVVLGLVSVFR